MCRLKGPTVSSLLTRRLPHIRSRGGDRHIRLVRVRRKVVRGRRRSLGHLLLRKSESREVPGKAQNAQERPLLPELIGPRTDQLARPQQKRKRHPPEGSPNRVGFPGAGTLRERQSSWPFLRRDFL